MHKQSFGALLMIFAILSCFILAQPAFSQLTPANEKGVTIGHVHWIVENPDVHKNLLITTLGAEVASAGMLEMIKLPGVIILLTKGNPKEGPDLPTTDHFALAVKDLAAISQKLAAAGIPVSGDTSMATFPEGLKVEFIEDKNLAVPVAFHHFHLRTQDAESTLDWYRKHLGVEFPPHADFPGGKVLITEQSDPPRVPSMGYAFDHIGFEVKDLKEFCKNLEDQGVKLDMNIIEAPQIGLRVTFITDPVGTRIELTEGLTGE